MGGTSHTNLYFAGDLTISFKYVAKVNFKSICQDIICKFKIACGSQYSSSYGKGG